KMSRSLELIVRFPRTPEGGQPFHANLKRPLLRPSRQVSLCRVGCKPRAVLANGGSERLHLRPASMDGCGAAGLETVVGFNATRSLRPLKIGMRSGPQRPHQRAARCAFRTD